MGVVGIRALGLGFWGLGIVGSRALGDWGYWRIGDWALGIGFFGILAHGAWGSRGSVGMIRVFIHL